MIAPTSVSSRFNARPVTPCPKSSISFSLARVRPSTLATPAPISRTVPTFCFSVAVLTAAIWDSISCSKLAINFQVNGFNDNSKALLEGSQASFHTAVIDVAAHLDAHASDERRILRERDFQPGSIGAFQSGLHLGLQVCGQGDGALDFCRAPVELEFHQPAKKRQGDQVAPRLRFDQLPHRLADAVLIEPAIGHAKTEQLRGFASCLSGGSHPWWRCVRWRRLWRFLPPNAFDLPASKSCR